MADLQRLYDAVLNGDAKTSTAEAEAALNEGVDPLTLVNEAMIPAMDEVGRRFECNEFFVPELLIAARAMKSALEKVKPHLKSQGVQSRGRVIIGTVQGDLHDIGKNLVASLLEGGGFDVVDLGVDVAPQQFLEAVKSGQGDIVALSALLTTTMPSMRKTIEALQESGVRQNVKVIIGGAPITQEFAEQIGADGYSDNAAGAVRLARSLAAV